MLNIRKANIIDHEFLVLIDLKNVPLALQSEEKLNHLSHHT